MPSDSPITDMTERDAWVAYARAVVAFNARPTLDMASRLRLAYRRYLWTICENDYRFIAYRMAALSIAMRRRIDGGEQVLLGPRGRACIERYDFDTATIAEAAAALDDPHANHPMGKAS